MITRSLLALTVVAAFAAPALAATTTERFLHPTHGIACEQGIKDVQVMIKGPGLGGKQLVDAQAALGAAETACAQGDQAAAEQQLYLARQLLARE